MAALLCALAGVGWGRAVQDSAPALPGYTVRIAYVIPSDRQPLPDYQSKAAVLLSRIRSFYADEMEANGLGRTTFKLELTADGRPAVHLLHSPMTAAVFADTGHARYVTGKYWEHAFQAVVDAGFAPDHPGQVWLCFVEAQAQLPDGSIHNDTTQGTGRSGNGFALCSGLELALGGDPNLIHDHRNYDGLILKQLGPYALRARVSFPSYEGDDVSSLAADFISATAHELGHCFLLQHCYLNDDTFCGNLMGNGFRGWRGYYMPAQFPREDTRLARPSALMLSLCPFFRLGYRAPADARSPTVEILTPSGPMHLVRGRLQISFEASDPGGPGIALATLENGQGRDGVGVVAYRLFEGHPNAIRATLDTTRIESGREDVWRLTVLDAAGNVAYREVKLVAPRTGIGPSPFISVFHSTVQAGKEVAFDGSVKRPWRFDYRWDFGDGSTAAGPITHHTFAGPGVYDVRLQVTDSGGRIGEAEQYMCVEAALPPDR